MRHFARRSALEIGVAQSFSKNFGLYGERVGAFHLLTTDPSLKPAIQSQLVRIIRSEVSSSPSFGCRIVAAVFADDRLREQWQSDLKTMSARIKSMREALYTELQRLGTPGDWGHIVSQVSRTYVLQSAVILWYLAKISTVRLECSRIPVWRKNRFRHYRTSITFTYCPTAGPQFQDVSALNCCITGSN